MRRMHCAWIHTLMLFPFSLLNHSFGIVTSTQLILVHKGDHAVTIISKNVLSMETYSVTWSVPTAVRLPSIYTRFGRWRRSAL